MPSEVTVELALVDARPFRQICEEPLAVQTRTADVGLSNVGFATDPIVPTARSAGVGVRCNIAVGSRLTAYFSATGTLTLARVVARTVTTFGTARAA